MLENKNGSCRKDKEEAHLTGSDLDLFVPSSQAVKAGSKRNGLGTGGTCAYKGTPGHAVEAMQIPDASVPTSFQGSRRPPSAACLH